MYPLLVFDGNDADETNRAKAAFGDIIELALSLDGTIAGEHGVGTLKREYVEQELDPVQLATQLQVREMFDPRGRFNPGKKVI